MNPSNIMIELTFLLFPLLMSRQQHDSRFSKSPCSVYLSVNFCMLLGKIRSLYKLIGTGKVVTYNTINPFSFCISMAVQTFGSKISSKKGKRKRFHKQSMVITKTGPDKGKNKKRSFFFYKNFFPFPFFFLNHDDLFEKKNVLP